LRASRREVSEKWARKKNEALDHRGGDFWHSDGDDRLALRQ
jgi:hypothetical protein